MDKPIKRRQRLSHILTSSTLSRTAHTVDSQPINPAHMQMKRHVLTYFTIHSSSKSRLQSPPPPPPPPPPSSPLITCDTSKCLAGFPIASPCAKRTHHHGTNIWLSVRTDETRLNFPLPLAAAPHPHPARAPRLMMIGAPYLWISIFTSRQYSSH